MKIDLSSIPHEDFNVREDGGLVLITPTKGKHVWREDELHLRSLITDLEGNVLSSGLPKFFNYNENSQHDEEFRQAFHRNAVTFTKKLDGSMIILDYIDEEPHFRTRGSHSLGDFEQPVMRLIREKYPTMLDWYTSNLYYAKFTRDHFSIIFEYTSPDNRIVVPYATSQLTLLAVVDKATLEPVWDTTILHLLAEDLGVPLVEPMELPSDLVGLIDTVRAWKGEEGVVARFVGTLDGIHIVPRMLKIKSTEYIQLHALKFRLEGKVGKLLYLLDAENETDARQKLYRLGIDFEAQSFVETELLAYFDAVVTMRTLWSKWVHDVFWPAKDRPCSDPREHRKVFVETIKHHISTDDYPDEFFTASMHWYEGDGKRTSQHLMATLVLQESPVTVRNWKKDEITAMLSARVVDDN